MLYIIYVNDIPRPGVPIAQYADDTAAFYRDKDVEVLVRRLQHALDELLQYFKRWRLKINAQKTEAVFFTKRRPENVDDHLLRVEALPIPWQPSARFLGVILDRRMTFGAHIRTVQKKAAGGSSESSPDRATSGSIRVRAMCILNGTRRRK